MVLQHLEYCCTATPLGELAAIVRAHTDGTPLAVASGGIPLLALGRERKQRVVDGGGGGGGG
jgi:hypothetical protein